MRLNGEYAKGFWKTGASGSTRFQTFGAIASRLLSYTDTTASTPGADCSDSV